MFWAARPASNRVGPFPETVIATTRGAPVTLPGAKTVSASRSFTLPFSTTWKRHGCRFIALPARRPASRMRLVTLSGIGLAA